MKKVTLIVCLICIFGFNSQPDIQKRAQKGVSDFLKNAGEDASMYSPVRWGKVEKFMTTYEMTETYKLSMELLKKQEAIINQAKEAKSVHENARGLRAVESSKELLAGIDSSRKLFKPIQYGWKIFHQYKFPNGFHVMSEFGRVFYLDKKLNVVISDTISLPY